MGLLENVKRKAQAGSKHIVLPEGIEPRIVAAAAQIVQEGIANITLLGPIDEIHEVAAKQNVSLEGVQVIDPVESEKLQSFADQLYEMRKAKGMTPDQALEMMKQPMYFGTMMLKLDEVDGLVGGALCTTGDTLRPGLQIVKTAPGVSTVSSCFVMEVQDHAYGEDGVLIFGDCAINIEPTPDQLADIAIASAWSAKALFGIEPRVAMLSFSTKGSAKHPLVDKVVEATAIVKAKAPDMNVDGELQADAALVASVGQLKSPGSQVAGKANVLIFPDLQAGNIGYKLVQRLGNASAIGPLCQGFAKPINDLSRGCSVDDIVNVVAMSVLQAQV